MVRSGLQQRRSLGKVEKPTLLAGQTAIKKKVTGLTNEDRPSTSLSEGEWGGDKCHKSNSEQHFFEGWKLRTMGPGEQIASEV